MAWPTEKEQTDHSSNCNLNETAYQQQQRLGIQQKPPPLRVKRPRTQKNPDLVTKLFPDSSPQTLPPPAHVHQISPNQAFLSPPLSSAHSTHQTAGESGGSCASPGGTTSPSTSSNLHRAFPAPQQFTSGVQNPVPQVTQLQQQQQHHQEHLMQQHSQFLQQIQAHPIYHPFYMQ